MQTHRTVLACDIGGIIIPLTNNGEGKPIFFTNEYLRLSPMVESIRALREVVEVLGPGSVYLMSRAEPGLERRLLTWLRHHRVFELTGIAESHLAVPGDKATSCCELHVTHYINDKHKELDALQGSVLNLFLFDPDDPVGSWRRIIPELLK